MDALLQFAGNKELLVLKCKFEVHIVDQMDAESNALEEFKQAADSPMLFGFIKLVSSTNPMFVCKAERGKCNPFRRWNTFNENDAKAAGAGPDILALSLHPQTRNSANSPSVQKPIAADRPPTPIYGYCGKISKSLSDEQGKFNVSSNVSSGSTSNTLVTLISKGIASDAASDTVTNTATLPITPNDTSAFKTSTITHANSKPAAALVGNIVAPTMAATPATVPVPSASSIFVPYFGSFVPYFADAAARSLVGHPIEAIPTSCLEELSTTEVYAMDNFGQGTSGPRVLVYSADLTRVVVDSLAVPSDGMLSTNGGLAQALLLTTGPGVGSALAEFKKSRNGSL